MNIGNDDSANLTTIADKLRYYQHRNGLLQREGADHVGVERTTYSAYEEYVRDYYPSDMLENIAEFLKVKCCFTFRIFEAQVCIYMPGLYCHVLTSFYSFGWRCRRLTRTIITHIVYKVH